jgi:hypothetical protein
MRTGPTAQLNNCQPSYNNYTYYMEYIYGNSATCNSYGVSPALDVNYYAVAAYPIVGTGYWLWIIDGPIGALAAGYEYLGQATAIPAVGEELNNTVGTQCQASSSSTAGFYAYPYSIVPDAWYVYFQTDGGDPQPITNNSNTTIAVPTNTALWSIPAVPFNETTISHAPSSSCDTNHGNG